MTKEAVMKRLADKAKRMGSNAALAKDIGASKAYVGEVLNGTRDPGPVILRYLGLEARIRREYVEVAKKVEVA